MKLKKSNSKSLYGVLWLVRASFLGMIKLGPLTLSFVAQLINRAANEKESFSFPFFCLWGVGGKARVGVSPEGCIDVLQSCPPRLWFLMDVLCRYTERGTMHSGRRTSLHVRSAFLCMPALWHRINPLQKVMRKKRCLLPFCPTFLFISPEILLYWL